LDWMTVIIIAIGLGMDAFAVALVCGTRQTSIHARPLFRLSFHFGLFQFLMPVIGWYLGTTVDQYIKDYAHWIAAGLLFYIGIKMFRESFSSDSEESGLRDPTKGSMMVILSIATSIDAFAVGLSLAFLGTTIWFPSVVIGIVALIMTAVGMIFGKSLGRLFGKKMELLGGLILIGIGIKIVVEHLLL